MAISSTNFRVSPRTARRANKVKSLAKLYNRDLKMYIGRQSDDDGQNKFIQINDCKESLWYIINCMNLTQLEEIKTEAVY
jgi:type II secretory pathway pseudopilin PulG